MRNRIATGSRRNARDPSCHAASTKTANATAVPAQAVRTGMRPVTSGRLAVRGFSPSSTLSARRLHPIATVRAAAIATVIQPNWYQVGLPLAPRTIPT